ncbi:MAG: sensor histidine kinase, partial [Vulcanimicrobiaceae bacterium]
SRERNDLLAAVGHEIRTPLTSIRGYIETVLDDDANRSEERRFLMTAQREAARLARFVDGLLTCSLLDIQGNLDRSECDLLTGVSAACDIVGPIAATLQVELRDEIRQNARLCCPEDVLVRILNILLENAINYGAQPGVIEIRGCVDDTDVLISVHDNGPGIAPGDEDRIFAPVQRGRNAHGSGCGLGLAIAKSLVEQYGGDIAVATSPLGGAQFDVRFERKAEASANAAKAFACDTSAHATLRRSDDRKPRTRSR